MEVSSEGAAGVSISPSRPLRQVTGWGKACRGQRPGVAFSNHALGAVLHDIAHLRVHQANARCAPTAPAFLSQGRWKASAPKHPDQDLDAPMAGLGLGAVTRFKQGAPNARVPRHVSPRRSGARVPGRRSSIKGSTSSDAVAQIGVGLLAGLRARSNPCVGHGPTGRVWTPQQGRTPPSQRHAFDRPRIRLAHGVEHVRLLGRRHGVRWPPPRPCWVQSDSNHAVRALRASP